MQAGSVMFLKDQWLLPKSLSDRWKTLLRRRNTNKCQAGPGWGPIMVALKQNNVRMQFCYILQPCPQRLLIYIDRPYVYYRLVFRASSTTLRFWSSLMSPGSVHCVRRSVTTFLSLFPSVEDRKDIMVAILGCLLLRSCT